MKLKRVHLIVESLGQTNARWKRALKGKARSLEPVITVASFEVLGKILSSPRLEILAAIPRLQPRSIAALARALKRDFKNVHSDVRFLADLGLLELREEGRRGLVPVARFRGLDVDLGNAA